MATLNYLLFEDSEYKVHTKDNNIDLFDIIRYISPRAWAKTDAGRYYYKVFLPQQRKLAKTSGSWRELEDLLRKNISEQYSEFSECCDPDIPF